MQGSLHVFRSNPFTGFVAKAHVLGDVIIPGRMVNPAVARLARLAGARRAVAVLRRRRSGSPHSPRANPCVRHPFLFEPVGGRTDGLPCAPSGAAVGSCRTQAMNRAMDGDTVVIEMLPEAMWSAQQATPSTAVQHAAHNVQRRECSAAAGGRSSRSSRRRAP